MQNKLRLHYFVLLSSSSLSLSLLLLFRIFIFINFLEKMAPLFDPTHFIFIALLKAFLVYHIILHIFLALTQDFIYKIMHYNALPHVAVQ